MKKKTAIKMLGGTPKIAAQAMGYKSVQAIYMWPETLPRSIEHRVKGAVQSMPKPKPLMTRGSM